MKRHVLPLSCLIGLSLTSTSLAQQDHKVTELSQGVCDHLGRRWSESASYVDASHAHRKAGDLIDCLAREHRCSHVAATLHSEWATTLEITLTHCLPAERALGLAADAKEDIVACAQLVAEHIVDEDERVSMLGTIARNYVDTGRLDRAVEIASRLPGESFPRSMVLNAVALRYADGGNIARAISVAQCIGPNHKPSLLRELADRCVTPEQFDQVVEAARRAGAPYARAIALARLAGTDAAGTYEHTERLLSEAVEASTKDGQPDSRSFAQSEIARVLAKQEQAKAATDILAQARASALTIASRSSRCMSLSGIATQYADLGLACESLTTLAAMDDALEKHRTLSNMAYAFAAANQFTEALEMAGRIDNALHRASVMREIARKHAKIGQHVQAVDIAASIDDGPGRASAFADIAGSHIEAAQEEQANRLLELATETAATIQNPVAKAESLAQIADKYAALGCMEQVQRILGQARSAAASVADTCPRHDALEQIARCYAAFAHFDEAFETAGLIDDARVRADALAYIAEKCTKIGQLARVVEMAQALEVPNEEAYVLTRVVERHAEADRCELALSIAKKITDGLWRGTAFAFIAKRYARAGRCSDAIGMAQMIEDSRDRVDSLCYIAHKCANAKVGSDALSVALAAVKDIDVALDKASALLQIAREYARMGHELSNADREELRAIVHAIESATTMWQR